MARFSIDQKILEKAINYMVTKPYQEVAQMLAEVQQDVRIIEEKPDGGSKPDPGQ